MKHRYLRAIGVDVWIRRGLLGSIAGEDLVDAAPAAASSPGDGTGLHLVFVAYDHLGMVFSMPPEDRLTSCQRLCDDIARAATGSRSKGKFSELAFSEQKSSSAEDASPAAELRRRLANLPRRIIVFGDAAVDHIHAGERNEVVDRFDKLVLGAPDIGHILDQPLKKKEVWQGLLKLQCM